MHACSRQQLSYRRFCVPWEIMQVGRACLVCPPLPMHSQTLQFTGFHPCCPLSHTSLRPPSLSHSIPLVPLAVSYAKLRHQQGTKMTSQLNKTWEFRVPKTGSFNWYINSQWLIISSAASHWASWCIWEVCQRYYAKSRVGKGSISP